MMMGCLAKTSVISPAGGRPTRAELAMNLDVTNGAAHLSITLDAIVYTLRVRHVLEHDIADLQCGLAETQLE